MSKKMPVRGRLSRGHLWSMIGFAALSLGLISVDWVEIQAQDATPEVKKDPFAEKAAQRKEARKKALAAANAASAPAARPTPGTGQKLDAVALTKIIDQEVQRKLAEEKIPVSPLAGDAEFFRRVHLDLAGTIPTAEKVAAFLDSNDPNKRSKAINELLENPRFGQFIGEIWSGMMLPRESNNRKLDHSPMVKWLAENFNKNTPLNEMVFDLITSTGDQDVNGAVTYFVANPTIDKITDNVSRMFLGVQLQCAQCHNHPFTDWKQKEYWGMAQFFIKTKLTANPQQAAKKGISPGIVENNAKANKKNVMPESAMKVSAKFLGAEEPKLNPADPYRPTLAKWMTSPENPFFARAMVNRFWHHLFGRGIVNPVDDMHAENAPTHPELLDALTEQFKSSNFDLKNLVRAICNSEAYQRTSGPTGDNGDDRVYYSHRVVRVMLPEQMYDSLIVVLGQPAKGKKGTEAPVAQKKGPGGPREQFVNFFRVSDEPDALQYETGIPQALRMMNSGQTNNFNMPIEQAIRSAGGSGPEKVIERIYLTGLSRRPTPEETQRIMGHVKTAAAPRTVYTDLYWAIINSSEFILNH